MIIVLGGLVLVSGVLGVLGKLPRNRLVGVRTPATLRSDRAFETGNRAAGPAVILGGLAAVISGVVAFLVPASAVGGCVLVGALVMAGLAVIGGLQGSRAASR